MKDVFHEGLHYFTHADKGFFLLLKNLIYKNGTIAKDYVEGKRKKYFPPLNFYLVVATILVLVFSLITNSTKPASSDHPELKYIKDPVQRAEVTRIYDRQAIAVQFINKYSNIVAMIAIPLICFIYWLFYRKGKYNYTEHMVACMYMMGFANLFYALIIVPLSILLNLKSSYPLLVLTLFVIPQMIYCSVFYYRFMGKGTRSSALKATSVSIFAVAFWFVFSSLLVGLYIKNGFWGIIK